MRGTNVANLKKPGTDETNQVLLKLGRSAKAVQDSSVNTQSNSAGFVSEISMNKTAAEENRGDKDELPEKSNSDGHGRGTTSLVSVFFMSYNNY